MKGPMSESDASSFLDVSREVFAPLYPYYAARFLEHSGLRQGRCLDVGCGGGDLGIAVARQSDCSIVFVDQAPPMIRAACDRADEAGLSGRFVALVGDVHALPLAESSVDLVVSRGSLMFWDDLPRAFASIHRVLRPGGMAICGGGLGPIEIRETICREMARRDARWQNGIPPPRPGTDPDRHAKALRSIGIECFDISREETGHWVMFGKQDPENTCVRAF